MGLPMSFISFLKTLYTGKMLKLEHPNLGLKTHKRAPTNWLTQGFGDHEDLLVLAPHGGEIYWNSVDRVKSYAYMMPGETDIDMPDAAFTVVFLNHVFERYPADGRKKILNECARMVKPGGTIISIDNTCNDAHQVFDLMYGSGHDIQDFFDRRLSNKDIVSMKPIDAAFFDTMTRVPSRKMLVPFLQGIGFPDVELEDLFKADEKFAVNRFYVGMKWRREK